MNISISMENGNIGDSLKSSLEYAFTELLEETFPYNQISTSVSTKGIFDIQILLWFLTVNISE